MHNTDEHSSEPSPIVSGPSTSNQDDSITMADLTRIFDTWFGHFTTTLCRNMLARMCDECLIDSLQDKGVKVSDGTVHQSSKQLIESSVYDTLRDSILTELHPAFRRIYTTNHLASRFVYTSSLIHPSRTWSKPSLPPRFTTCFPSIYKRSTIFRTMPRHQTYRMLAHYRVWHPL